MTYTFNFRHNEDGSIDYDFYKAQARTARQHTRTRVFAGCWRSWRRQYNPIGLMLRSAKRVSKHEAAPSFETPR